MRKRVIIESPYSGKTDEQVAEHERYARRALLDSLQRLEAPFGSHLLYTQVLDDKVPKDRTLGIMAGFAWGDVAELTAVYVDYGVSDGMRLGIEAAEQRQRPVEHRSIGKNPSE